MNPPLALTRSMLHPQILGLQVGYLTLNLPEGTRPLGGPRVGVSLGADLGLTPALNLRVLSSYQSASLSRGDDQLTVNSFGLEAGPNLALLDRWLNLGFYGGVKADIYQTENNGINVGARLPRYVLNNRGAASWSLRPEVCFRGQSVCISYEYTQSLGLALASGASSFTTYPSSHFVGGMIDVLKLFSLEAGRAPYVDASLAHFWRDSDLSLHIFGSSLLTSGLFTGSGPAELSARTRDHYPSWGRLNNAQLLFEHAPTRTSRIGGSLGLNLGADHFVNPSFGINADIVKDDPSLAMRGGLQFLLFPAYVSYMLHPQFVLDGGLFPGTLGPEDAFPQSRTAQSLSLLFNYQPFTLFGARGTYTFNDNHKMYLGITNGSDGLWDHHLGPTGIGGWTGTFENHTLAIHTLFGHEDAGYRAILDGIWTYTVKDNDPNRDIHIERHILTVNADVITRADPITHFDHWYAGANALYEFRFAEGTEMQRDPVYRARIYTRAEVLYDGGIAGPEQFMLSALVGARYTFPEVFYGDLTLSVEGRMDAFIPRDSNAANPLASSHLLPTLGINVLWSGYIHRH